MANTWDQVRHHERRRRIRRVLAAAALLLSLYAVGKYLGIPQRISQFQNQYRAKHVDPHNQPSEGSGASIRESRIDSTAATAMEGGASPPQSYDVESQDPTQFSVASSDIADTQGQDPLFDEVDPKRRTPQADPRLKKLTSRIAEVVN